MSEMYPEKAAPEEDEREAQVAAIAAQMCEQDPDAARDIAWAVLENLAGSVPLDAMALREQTGENLVEHAREGRDGQYWERTLRTWAMRCWYAGRDAGYQARKGEERAGLSPVTYGQFLSMLGEGMHTAFRKCDGPFLYAIHRLIRESPEGDWRGVCDFAGSFIWSQLRDGGMAPDRPRDGSPPPPAGSAALRARADLEALPEPRTDYGRTRRRLMLRYLDEVTDTLDAAAAAPEGDPWSAELSSPSAPASGCPPRCWAPG